MAIDYSSIYGYNNTNYNLSINGVNTSTARFKGTVTGYKGVEGKYGGVTNNAMTSNETKEYLSGLKEFGNGLKSAADAMLSRFPPLFEQMTAASNNNDVMSVTYDSKKGKAVSNFDVEVKQTATTQKNTGDKLKASAKVDSSTVGYNSFAIETGGKTSNFNVYISSSDTNQQAQQKMADAINKSNTGVTAKVAYDAITKESSLVLESKETGEKSGFTIRDTGSGSLVQKSGANNTSQTASDAIYSIDGTDKKSSSNTVDLGNGITGTLKKAGTATVGMKQDTNSIINAIYDLVNNYNGLLEVAKDNSNDSGAQNLIRQLSGATSAYKTTLSKIGISTNSNGYLTIDESKLKSSVENGSAKTALDNGTSNYGFVNRMSQIGSSVDSNPSRYVSKASYSTVNTGSYSSASNSNGLGLSFWTEFKMSQMTGVGLLFDGMF